MMAPPSLHPYLDHLDQNGLEFEIVEEPDDLIKNIPIRSTARHSNAFSRQCC
jgi:hypothetical protein